MFFFVLFLSIIPITGSDFWMGFYFNIILYSILQFLMFLPSAAARDIFNPFKACFNNNNGQNNLSFFCNMKQRKMFVINQAWKENSEASLTCWENTGTHRINQY